MKTLVAGWLIFGIILAALSYALGPFLGKCGDEDTAFAHEYAGEMLARLEQMSAAGDGDSYRAAEADFGNRKQAAVHLKGELAYDFVYAFSWAEDWCRYAAGGRSDEASRADEALRRAKAEFRAIGAKGYKNTGR